jgi:predicted DNA-binding transcriptional regulator YafY
MREGAEAASAAVVVDPVAWDRRPVERPAPPHLECVQRAVVEGRQLRLGYVSRDRTPSQRIVHPLGLAAKGLNWYLVAATDAGLRTFRVDRITSAEETGEPVVRPHGFNLAEAWKLITENVDQLRTPVQARAAADPSAVHWLRYVFGTRLSIGPTRDDGRVEVEVRGHHVWSLAREISGVGRELEVLDPPELREHLANIGAGLVATYRPNDA